MFEWDDVKRLENIEERGVDFRIAAQIFLNPPFIEADDTREDYGEDRYRAMGSVDGETYLVVYTWRGETRRIITAWRVGEDGKERYTKILGG
jgi:uncharacterized DUF497 family protein